MRHWWKIRLLKVSLCFRKISTVLETQKLLLCLNMDWRHICDITEKTFKSFWQCYFCQLNFSGHIHYISYSKKLTLKHGDPDGSVLSKFIFLVYMNNLTHYTKNSRVIWFPDDTLLISYIIIYLTPSTSTDYIWAEKPKWKDWLE